MANVPSNRARGGNCGGSKVDFAFNVSHASDKVAVCRCNRSFACGEYAHMTAKAGATGRSGNDTASVNKNPRVAFFEALHINFLRCGDYYSAKTLFDVSALEYFGGGGHILDVTSLYEGKPSITVLLSDDLVARGYNAVNITREAAKLIQGGGGGQPFFATAGGKNPEGLDKAMEMMKL